MPALQTPPDPMWHRLRLILLTVFVDGIVLGVIIPVLPRLLADLENASVTDVITWGGVMTACFGTAQFVCSPLLGAMSDAYGRRPIILFSLVVLALEFLLILVADNIWLVVLAHVIGGAGSANRVVVSAIISDQYQGDDRARGLGWHAAAFALGMVFGPVIGGAAAVLDLHAPFIVILMLIFASFLLVLIAFQETLPQDRRTSLTIQAIRPMSYLLGALKTGGARRSLLLAYFFYSMAFMVYLTLWSYYTQGFLQWTMFQLGLSVAVFAMSLILTQALVVKKVTDKIGLNRAVFIALVGNIAAAVFLVLVTNDGLIFLTLPLIALFSVAEPLMQTTFSHIGDTNDQGVRQGQWASVRALASVVSPLVLAPILAGLSDPLGSIYFPPGLFLVVAALFGLSLRYWLEVSSNHKVSQPHHV